MDPINQIIEGLDKIDFSKQEHTYAIAAEVIKSLTEKITEFETKAKKLKAKREEIKEIIRQRMVDEKLPACDTENGRFRPTSSDCITMQNFELFKDWLREDMKRLDYLKQSCFDSNKMKQVHADPEDLLPPGIGIYQKVSLSVTKIPKKKG